MSISLRLPKQAADVEQLFCLPLQSSRSLGPAGVSACLLTPGKENFHSLVAVTYPVILLNPCNKACANLPCPGVKCMGILLFPLLPFLSAAPFVPFAGTSSLPFPSSLASPKLSSILQCKSSIQVASHLSSQRRLTLLTEGSIN